MKIFESWLDRAGRNGDRTLTDREAYSASPSHERFLPKLATVFAEGYGGKRLRAELGAEAPVIATGGLAPVFQAELALLTAVEPDLTLEGLRLIWEKNRR